MELKAKENLTKDKQNVIKSRKFPIKTLKESLGIAYYSLDTQPQNRFL